MQTTFKRPFKPVDLTPATIEAFDLQALARQIRQEKPFIEHGRNGLTLTWDDQLAMVLTVAKEGKLLLEPPPWQSAEGSALHRESIEHMCRYGIIPGAIAIPDGPHAWRRGRGL